MGSASSSKAEDDEESGRSQRPRRSTRTRIDYANPDAATVIAEVDDEEPGGLNVTRKGQIGRGSGGGAGRGKKRGNVTRKQKVILFMFNNFFSLFCLHTYILILILHIFHISFIRYKKKITF